MLTNSRDIYRRLEADGWVLRRTKGSHHQFKKAGVPQMITLVHYRKDTPIGTVKEIYRNAGWPKD